MSKSWHVIWFVTTAVTFSIIMVLWMWGTRRLAWRYEWLWKDIRPDKKSLKQVIWDARWSLVIQMIVQTVIHFFLFSR